MKRGHLQYAGWFRPFSRDGTPGRWRVICRGITEEECDEALSRYKQWGSRWVGEAGVPPTMNPKEYKG